MDVTTVFLLIGFAVLCLPFAIALFYMFIFYLMKVINLVRMEGKKKKEKKEKKVLISDSNKV